MDVRIPLVIPCHCDTFPPIGTDAEQFKCDVEGRGKTTVALLAPGEIHAA